MPTLNIIMCITLHIYCYFFFILCLYMYTCILYMCSNTCTTWVRFVDSDLIYSVHVHVPK